jgi:hypothetical protein
VIPVKPQTDSYREIRRELYRRCEHPAIELRYMEQSDGKRQYREQCTTCGGTVRNVKKASINPERLANVPPVDKELQSTWWRDRDNAFSQRLEAQRQEEQARWWNWYNTYLKSPQWHQKRDLVLQRANGVCEGCELEPAIQVHHLTYVRVGDELLFDLVAVCTDCHQKAHPDKDLGAGGPIE